MRMQCRLLVFALGCAATLAAQTQPALTPTWKPPETDVVGTTAVPPAGAPKTAPTEPSVVPTNGTMKTQQWVRLGETVTVAVTGLREWAQTPGHSPANLRLYLAGRLLPAGEPTLFNLTEGYLNFPLALDASDRAAWVQILTEARKKPIALSIGLKDTKEPFASTCLITIGIYSAETPFVAAFLVIVLVAMVWLGRKTALLRIGDVGTPYSLGRVQMACWFYMVVACYLYIWRITGEYNTLNNSILALIGISGMTGLAAEFVGRKDRKPGDAAPALKSKEFFLDILSDGDGVSFHRFQMAVWTVVMAMVFVRAVYRDLAMPEFDNSFLGLMGISSGTYVGFKFPEKPKTADEAEAKPDAPAN